MSVIQINELTFCYENSYNLLFDHVSFQLDTDWKLGFIGRNGRGKTTFLKLLMKQYAYSGSIHTSEDFAYFPFSVENPSDITFYILERLNPDMELWQISKELNQMGACPQDILYRPFCTLSQGEQTKVLLAALFLKENTFLLIDEPTNHLDARARQKVADYLSSKKGFILVSHDRAFLDACIDHVLVLNRQNIEVQKGNFSSWYANKQAADHLEEERSAKLKKDIRKLDIAAKQTARWADKIEQTKTGTRIAGLRPDRGYIGHQSAKMMKRAKSLEARQQTALTEKRRLLKNIEKVPPLKLNPIPFHTDRLLSLQKLTVTYDQEPLFTPLTLELHAGDRIALTGKNGCGKSSILRLLTGELIPFQGNYTIASGLKISYVPQDTSFLKGTIPDFAEKENINEALFKTVLAHFGMPCSQFEQHMEVFSEGQKKKVLLASSLCQEAHLFLWDEPLNFIDIFSRMQLEELLLKYKPTLLFIEHDHTFTQNIATKIIPL